MNPIDPCLSPRPTKRQRTYTTVAAQQETVNLPQTQVPLPTISPYQIELEQRISAYHQHCVNLASQAFPQNQGMRDLIYQTMMDQMNLILRANSNVMAEMCINAMTK